MPHTKPSERGKELHPPFGYYDGIPCTCLKECSYFCKGACGCEACKTAFSDFLSDPEV